MFRRSMAALAAALLMCGVGCQSGPMGFGARKSQEKFDIAHLHEKDGQLAKARDLYAELHLRSGDRARVCQRLGVVNARLGNHDAANQYFEEALDATPENPAILGDYGYALLLQGEYERAETVLGKAAKLDGSDRRSVNNLGLAVAHQGRNEEALRLFRSVNDDAAAHANLAYVLAQRGEGQQAIAHYSQALSIDPDHPVGRQGLLQIAELEMQTRNGTLDARNVAKRSEPEPAASDDAHESVVGNGTPDAVAKAVGTSAPDSAAKASLVSATASRPQFAKASSAQSTVPSEPETVVQAEASGTPVVQTPSSQPAEPNPAETVLVSTDEASTSRGHGDRPDIEHLVWETAPSGVRPVSGTDAEVNPVRETGVEDAPAADGEAHAVEGAGPYVRWEQLTVSHAQHGGRREALEVFRRAVLDLAREADFPDVTRQYSDDEFATNGGDVGWVPVSKVPAELASTLQRLPEGVISQVIEGDGAYRIVRVVGRRSGSAATN